MKREGLKMLNRALLVGRLTRDPELRRTGSGKAVTSFNLAVERKEQAMKIGSSMLSMT